MLRTRSYSMGLSINGQPLTSGPIFWPPNFAKESEIRINTMKTLCRNDSIGIGERARLGRSRLRPRRQPLRTNARIISCLPFAEGSARRRAERQPWRLRSPLLSPESFRLKAAFIALTCAAALLLTSALKAQTFTTLYSFTALSNPFTGTNSDGYYPSAGLILSGNTLYGTVSQGENVSGPVSLSGPFRRSAAAATAAQAGPQRIGPTP